LPISTAPLILQSAVIKLAYEALSVYNSSAIYARNNFTLSYAVDQAGFSPGITNVEFGNLTFIDFFTCLTSHIEAVWPGSNLTVNTTNIINCQPVIPITIQEFFNTLYSILNTGFLRERGGNFDYSNQLQLLKNDLTSRVNTTQLVTLPYLKRSMSSFAMILLDLSPINSTTTVGTLVGLYNANLSSEIRPDLLNTLVIDYLACFTNGAPWSANYIAG
jgi:hypothetical protein